MSRILFDFFDETEDVVDVPREAVARHLGFALDPAGSLVEVLRTTLTGLTPLTFPRIAQHEGVELEPAGGVELLRTEPTGLEPEEPTLPIPQPRAVATSVLNVPRTSRTAPTGLEPQPDPPRVTRPRRR
jgi:hypothetical protein